MRRGRERDHSLPITRRSTFTPTRLFRPTLILRPMPPFTVSPRLSEVEDRRTFTFSRPRPAVSFSGRPHTLTVGRPARARPQMLPARVMFGSPDKMIICSRRKARKEVLFAAGKAGSQFKRRKPRRNWLSDIHCR